MTPTIRKVLDPDGDVCLQLHGCEVFPDYLIKDVKISDLSPAHSTLDASSSDTDDEPHEDDEIDSDTVDNYYLEEDYEMDEDDGGNNPVWDRTGVDGISGMTLNLHLIVSSKAMSLASPMFKAMFFGKFKEGVELAQSKASSKIYRVDLPEDPPMATYILCSILHAKDELPRLPHTWTLAQLAMLADKYQCGQALRYHARYWLSNNCTQLSWFYKFKLCSRETPEQARPNLFRMVHCLLVSYILDLPGEYAMISAMIVRHDNGHTLDDISRQPWCNHFRHGVLDKLRSVRKRALNQIYDAMMEPRLWSRARIERHDLMGRSSPTILKRHMEYLTDHLLWPPPSDFLGLKLNGIYQEVQAIPDGHVISYLCRPLRRVCIKQDHKFDCTDGLETGSPNLCLDCTTGASNDTTECRTGHFWVNMSPVDDYDGSEGIEITDHSEEDSDNEAFNIPQAVQGVSEEDEEEDEDEDGDQDDTEDTEEDEDWVDDDDTDEDMDI